jgi:hypothetical protein
MPDIEAVYRKAVVTALALAAALGARAQCPSPCAANVTLVNAELVLSDAVRLRIPRLRGQIVAAAAGRPVPFHPDALLIRIDAAEVRLSTTSLTALMNGYVLRGATIRNVTIDTDPSRREVIINGPVSLRGPLTVSGNLIHLRRNRLWLPFVDGLINWDRGPAQGIQARNGVILLDPIRMIAPLLRIEGRLTAIAVEGKEIVETFGPPEAAPPQEPGSIRVEGGDLLIGGVRTSIAPYLQRAESGSLTVVLSR